MDEQNLRALLEAVKSGDTEIGDAVRRLKTAPFEDLGFAKVDHHRALRHGVPEVIFGEGKTADQIIAIARSIRQGGVTGGADDQTAAAAGAAAECVMITRLSRDKADAVARELPIAYDPVPRIALLGSKPAPRGTGYVAVATAGTSDIPVAEEAAVTAECLGTRVERVYDVGVAGLHRLLGRLDVLVGARVVVAVAGMEGALATAVGGLVSAPVIAVPSSVGYGASFHGLAALLSMLNSCSGNVSAVNIDNGFGAGYLASLINRIGD